MSQADLLTTAQRHMIAAAGVTKGSRSMARRFFLLLALIAPAILLSDAARACSCIASSTTPKQEREWMQQAWEYADTIVLVRTLTASTSKDRDSQHATLLVVRAWKGPYKKGDHIESYTEEIGSGLCASPVPAFNPFLLYFKGAAHINGCDSDFVPTPTKSGELDRLKRKDTKAKNPP